MIRVVRASLVVLACLSLPVEALAAPPEPLVDADEPPTDQPPAPVIPEHDFRRPVDHEIAESSTRDTVDRGEVLALAEVLDSVSDHDPRLAAADHDIERSKGNVLSARGGFDTSLSFLQIYEPLYKSATTRVRVEQATPFYGLTAWAGWQIGVSGMPGVTPVWDPGSAGRLMSAEGGELFAGATLPLVRDGWTDRRRSDVEQSKLERERVGYFRDATQLALEAEAATAYWNWVAAGMQLEIEQQLLDLALVRNTKLTRQIELGAVDRLAGIDNKRVMLDREGRIVLAERTFQGAALALSLYLRDEAGNPVVAGADRLPRDLPTMPSPLGYDLDAEIAGAIDQRPDRRAQLRSREQSDVELRWAKNQRTPRVDLSAWTSHEIGRHPFLDAGETTPLRTELFTSIFVEIPIPMREARGRIQSAEASLDIVGSELRMLDNQIGVEVADAHLAVDAAYQRALLAGQQVELTEELAQAELRRFELGEGDLLLVNLRELAIADAASAEVSAVAEYFIAKAHLEVARGEGVAPVAP
ncbi:TolC family protein [Nannocystaceae bacterium ST9]